MPLHLRRQAFAPKAVFYKMVVLQRYPVLVAVVEFFLTLGHGIPFTRHFQCLKLLCRNNYGIDPAIFSMDTGAVLGRAKTQPNRFLACVAVICMGDFQRMVIPFLMIITFFQISDHPFAALLPIGKSRVGFQIYHYGFYQDSLYSNERRQHQIDSDIVIIR